MFSCFGGIFPSQNIAKSKGNCFEELSIAHNLAKWDLSWSVNRIS